MSMNDPFGLPDGYGGTGRDSGGPAPAAPRRKTIDELEAELRGIVDSPVRNARVEVPPPPFASGLPVGDGGMPPAPPPSKWRGRWKWAKRGLAAFLLFFIAAVAWLALTAPLSKSLEPIVPPQLTLVSAEGRPIARNGAVVDEPVDATKLPPHVVEAFLAIEDRRFYTHWGIDPRGLARAAWSNVSSGSTQGGSTITQQLAKITFLSADQTMSRKARELLIAWWMEAWLAKDDILSRYLSNAYFGDNVYGLRAASLHYFYRQPERLTLSQATMLAGLVKAPSRLAPTRNLARARERQRVVLVAMVAAGYLTEGEARAVRPAQIDNRARPSLPSGTYFADWAMPQARATIQPGYGEERVTTTLDARLQDIARRVTARGDLRGAQIALVAMRPNGEVVAMIGGRDYRASPFNRATQARRQPGSTFKLAVYLAALRSGLTPDSLVDDSPITQGDYRPANYGGRYRGEITLREAFAQSSNVVAVRLYSQVGGAAVRSAARDLGLRGALPENASVALGSAGTTLVELTSAYAMVAGNYGPVTPHALREEETGVIERLFDGRSSLPSRVREDMMELLAAAVTEGTGRAARLAIPAYGKTGTTQDSRDALFVGFAGDLVVGVWIGNDDNSPLRGMTGGGVPAQIWRDFMSRAIPGAAPQSRPRPEAAPDVPQIFDDMGVTIGDPKIRIDPDKGVALDTDVGGIGITLDSDGISVRPTRQPEPPQGNADPP
jgi:penicillin-binding protein 1A